MYKVKGVLIKLKINKISVKTVITKDCIQSQNIALLIKFVCENSILLFTNQKGEKHNNALTTPQRNPMIQISKHHITFNWRETVSSFIFYQNKTLKTETSLPQEWRTECNRPNRMLCHYIMLYPPYIFENDLFS